VEPSVIEWAEAAQFACRGGAGEACAQYACAWQRVARQVWLTCNDEIDSRSCCRFKPHFRKACEHKSSRIYADNEEEFEREDDEHSIQKETESYTMSYLAKKSACHR
jgi:hypothetical protein